MRKSIVIEDRLEELFLTLPKVKAKNDDNEVIPGIEKEVFFWWGDDSELNRYLALNPENYPLVWLVKNGNTESHHKRRVRQRLDLIIAVNIGKEDDSKLNDFHWQQHFKKIINIVSDNVVRALEASNITDLVDSRRSLYELDKRPRFSVNGENKTIHLWNASLLTVDVFINDDNFCKNFLVYHG